MNQSTDHLLRCRRPLNPPRARLLCLPYAGGGATIFQTWAGQLPADIEVRAAQFPGRQDRLGEPALLSVSAMSDAILAALAALPPAPLYLYGHSLGALIAFELARKLAARNQPPAGIIVGGRRAPHLPSRRAPIHTLSDADFKEALHLLYGTSRAVLQNSELMAIALPALRGDFTAHDAYQHAAGAPLDVPITVLVGQKDSSLNREEATAWAELTTRYQGLHEVDAGHLFVDTHAAWVIERVRAALAPTAYHPAPKNAAANL